MTKIIILILFLFFICRFGAGTKIAENFYARQDGTRTYFFQVTELGMSSQNLQQIFQAGDKLFDWYPVCPRPILVVCGLLPGENHLTPGCHWDSKAANFSPPVCSPTE
jgi:hypothetical protein